jgi:chemotaxis protein methyltransferase CheR
LKTVKLSPILQRVSDIVRQKTGIVLGPSKALMIQTRLLRRFHQLGIHGEDEYLAHLDKNLDAETEALVSLMTTHTTEFFREFLHFEYLLKYLPELIEIKRQSKKPKLRVWSAACSWGHEVYSLAMFLSVHWPKDLGFEVLGSDVDPESVQMGQNGVYTYNDVKQIPVLYMANHWTRGSGDISDYVRVRKHLRDLTRFSVANLLSLPPFDGQAFDLIFCRNVFIYFQPEQVQSACAELLKRLTPEGRLFVGTSESLQGLNLDVESPFPAVYQMRQNSKFVQKSPLAPSPVARTVPKELVRVLCVDDSPSILSLLEKILSSDNGFEIVGKAKNGKEAIEFLTQTPVDVITLDIHMPEMNGIEFLQKVTLKRPPVVMVSSVSREDSDLGLKALELGAADYVEKPSLGDLSERGEELRTKLKIAKSMAGLSPSQTSLAKEFSRKHVIWKPEQCLLSYVLSPSDVQRLSVFVGSLQKPMSHVVMFFDGPAGLLPGLKRELEDSVSSDFEILEFSPGSLRTNSVSIGILESSKAWFQKHESGFRAVVIGNKVPATHLGTLRSSSECLVLVEEGSQLRIPFARVLPATTLSYHAVEFLSLKTRAP